MDLPTFTATYEPDVQQGGGGNDGYWGGNNGDGGGGGGGGGDGGESGELLRLLSASERISVLNDWQHRCRIYKLSSNEAVVARHEDALEILAAMDAHTAAQDGERTRKRLTLALNDAEGAFAALSCADVSNNELTVRYVIANPAEIHTESTAALRLLHGMQLLAEAVELPLDISPLRDHAEAATNRLLSEIWQAADGL